MAESGALEHARTPKVAHLSAMNGASDGCSETARAVPGLHEPSF